MSKKINKSMPTNWPIPSPPKPVYMTWDRPVERRGYDVKTLYKDEAFSLLCDWQDNRCAMCGTNRESLVLDHCHESGLVRGFLCGGCNTREATGQYLEWNLYRAFPPTIMLDIKLYYNEYGSSPYPVQSKFPQATVDAEVPEWDYELCFRVVKDYCSGILSLDWLSNNEMRTVVRKAIEHYETISGKKIYTSAETERLDAMMEISNILSRHMK